jgi:hypothetical protein
LAASSERVDLLDVRLIGDHVPHFKRELSLRHFFSIFLSRIVSRERSVGAIVASCLRDNRVERVRVLRTPPSSRRRHLLRVPP